MGHYGIMFIFFHKANNFNRNNKPLTKVSQEIKLYQACIDFEDRYVQFTYENHSEKREDEYIQRVV